MGAFHFVCQPDWGYEGICGFELRYPDIKIILFESLFFPTRSAQGTASKITLPLPSICVVFAIISYLCYFLRPSARFADVKEG